ATQRATGVWQAALADYAPPDLDPAVEEELTEYVSRRKIEIGDGEP
ncbi:MAG: trimethylamine methyltransferase family protein, partial [Acidimicrobiales bacterium]